VTALWDAHERKVYARSCAAWAKPDFGAGHDVVVVGGEQKSGLMRATLVAASWF
jgi:hypothetical protein